MICCVNHFYNVAYNTRKVVRNSQLDNSFQNFTLMLRISNSSNEETFKTGDVLILCQRLIVLPEMLFALVKRKVQNEKLSTF